MASINIEQPPEESPVDLKSYLVRQLMGIDNALGQTHYFPPRSILPNKVRIGDIFYFKSAIAATPITGEGLWIYKSTGWTQII